MSWRWFTFIFLLPVLAGADERILGYDSDILVRSDGSIEVTETITVRAEGRQIRRGIYRDYPTRYEDRYGNDVEVIYEPRSLTRNGEPEAFFSENHRNGIRTYFGESDRMLPAGVHTYVYRYDAGRMLGFFPEYDELYWNVTGNGWAFPIDSATAQVRFEFDTVPGELQQSAWQGFFGSSEPGLANFDDNGEPVFQASRPLAQQEGFTIVVAWPKGLVPEPSKLQRFIWLLSDNLNLLIALAGLAAILAYYIPAWRGYGKDPEPGVIMPRYEPPDGFSPASLRYIENMGYDNETMTAGIVSLAVKGHLKIDVYDDVHSLHKLEGGTSPLAAGERELLDVLFAGRRHVALVNDNHEILGAAKKAHEASLKRDYHKRYFVTNGMLNLPPVIIGFIAMAAAALNRITVPMVAVCALMFITIVTFAILLKRPTRLGRALLDESAGFSEYLEIAEKDEMNLRNPPEKTPELFERYLPFALALGVEQQWADRFARIFAELRGPSEVGWQPSWYDGSWDNFDLGATTQTLSGSLGTAISSSVTPPGSSSGGGGGGGW